MAITQNLFINRTRKSAGAVTFQKWKRLNIMKAKNIAPSDPKTIPQLQNRAIIRYLAYQYQLTKEVTTVGMAGGNVNESPYNVFVRMNRKSGAVTPGNSNTIEPNIEHKLLVYSKGDYPLITDVNLHVTSAVTTITWENGTHPNRSAEDIIIAIFQQSDIKAPASTIITGAKYITGQIVFSPENESSVLYENIYIFVKSANSIKCSTTLYLKNLP